MLVKILEIIAIIISIMLVSGFIYMISNGRIFNWFYHSEEKVYTYNNKTVGDYEVSDTGIEMIVKVDGMGGYTSTPVMSKEAFVEAYEKYIKQSREKTVEEEIKVGDEVLEQEPKTGYWIDTGSGQECSECGEIQYGYDNFRFYCAKCGSKNVTESESDEE